jgi:hypothetical protein
MYSYSLLEPGCYYLIQEKEQEPLNLIKIGVETDHCIFLTKYGDEEVQEWKRKTDSIFDIVELLGDDAIRAWESSYNKDEYNYEEEDDD